MTVILHPIRALRENVRQIGTAINACREYSQASQTRPDGQPTPFSYIPL